MNISNFRKQNILWRVFRNFSLSPPEHADIGPDQLLANQMQQLLSQIIF